jgi:hypothetical protein
MNFYRVKGWRDDFADIWDAINPDYYEPELPAPRRVTPDTVQRRVRASGAQAIQVGEIVPVRAVDRGVGQLVRRKEEGWGGQRGLVTYDDRNNVYMRVFNANMNPTTDWFQIGAVSTVGLPTDRRERGIAIERRIRGLVSRTTGIAFRDKLGNQGRPDLQPTGKRARIRSRAGIGQSREFDDQFGEWEMLEEVQQGGNLRATPFGPNQ